MSEHETARECESGMDPGIFIPEIEDDPHEPPGWLESEVIPGMREHVSEQVLDLLDETLSLADFCDLNYGNTFWWFPEGNDPEALFAFYPQEGFSEAAPSREGIFVVIEDAKGRRFWVTQSPTFEDGKTENDTWHEIPEVRQSLLFTQPAGSFPDQEDFDDEGYCSDRWLELLQASLGIRGKYRLATLATGFALEDSGEDALENLCFLRGYVLRLTGTIEEMFFDVRTPGKSLSIVPLEDPIFSVEEEDFVPTEMSIQTVVRAIFDQGNAS